MQQRIITIILAGGEGKRMQSAAQKVMHPLCGKPMLDWVLDAASVQGAEQTPIAVVGVMQDQVREHFGERLLYVEQQRPRGSGNALIDARELLRGKTGRVLVLAGDLPLLRKDTTEKLTSLRCGGAFLTAELDEPYGHARVLRNAEGGVLSIIEENMLAEGQRTLRETLVCAYCFDIVTLMPVLDTLAQNKGMDQCSMHEIIGALQKSGADIKTVCIPAQEAQGVNDRIQLAVCEKLLRRRINAQHMLRGVTLIDPDVTYIDASVKLGRDCTIYPGVVLQGNTVIEEGSILFPACHITDSHFGRYVQARGVVARDAVVGDYVTMGPYVNLRPGTRLGSHVKVGNYIEVKNANVGQGSKLPHLSYIGDGDVGSHANLGCGTVFVNYDGYKKHRTKVGDGAFIGCHTSLVAPVTVGKGSFTAAGSVITEDVPENSLAVARAKQVNKIGYMNKLRIKRGDAEK